MIRLVPGLLSFLFAIPSAFAGTPTLVSWDKIANELNCDSATGAERMICDQARKAYCREYYDPKCTENADTNLESKLSKECASGTGDRTKTLAACSKMNSQMRNCCDSKNVGACLDEIGPALKLADPSEGSGIEMLCKKAGADMDQAATANAAIAGTCAMRGIVWREHCTDAMKSLRIATPSLTSEEQRAMNCSPYATPTEIRAQLDSLLDESKIAKECNDKSKNPDDPVAGPGTTSPGGGDTQSVGGGGGMGGGMEMLGAMMPLLGELMKPKTDTNGDGTVDENDLDTPSEITFENTECDAADATCIAKKLTEPAPVTADAAKLGASALPQFNPSTLPDVSTAGLGDAGKASDPSTNGTIPNGGGGIPGGGGGGGGGAMPGGRNTAGAGANTDIMKGFQGGGGYSEMNAGMSMTPTSTGGFRGYGGAGGDQSGVDLAQFLPNGSKDPRKGMGANDLRAIQMKAEISDKTVNMFLRVSERIKMRCAQGLLRDCVP